jgi:hypothetical protein
MMIMRYNDMKDVELKGTKSHCGSSRLRFKITGKQLREVSCCENGYGGIQTTLTPTFQTHVKFKGFHSGSEWVTIEFNCRSDVDRVKESVPGLR